MSSIDAAVAAANALEAVDFVVESAGTCELTLLGFVDVAHHARGRLHFDGPAYVQLPWRFSFRRLRVETLGALRGAASVVRPWQLPERSPYAALLPSLAFDELSELEKQGGLLFAFDDVTGRPAEPGAFIISRGIRVYPVSSQPELLPRAQDPRRNRPP